MQHICGNFNIFEISLVFLLSIFLVVTVTVTRKDADSVIHTLKVLGPQKIGPSETCVPRFFLALLNFYGRFCAVDSKDLVTHDCSRFLILSLYDCYMCILLAEKTPLSP